MPHKCKQTYQQPLHLIILLCCCFFKFALLLSPDSNEQPSISVLFPIAHKGTTRVIELVQSYAHSDLPNSYCKTAKTTTNSFLFTLQESLWILSLLCSCCLYLWHWHLGDFHLLSDLGWSTQRFSGTGTKAHFMHINQTKKAQRSALKFFPKSPLDYTQPENTVFLTAGVSCSTHFRSASAGHQVPPPTSWSQSIFTKGALACPHSSTTRKLEVQHKQRHFRNLSVTILSWKTQNIWRIFKRS